MFYIGKIFGKFLYPLPCLIVIKRQSGPELFFDRAKRVVDKETQKEWFRLQKMGPCKSTTFRNTIRSNKGLFSMMYSPGRNEFSPLVIKDTEKTMNLFDEVEADGKYPMVPLEIKDEEDVEIENKDTGQTETVSVPIVTPISEDQRDFLASMFERAYTRFSRKQSLLTRLLPIMAPVILAFALILVFWGYSSYGSQAIAQTVLAVKTALMSATEVATTTAAVVPVG